tara:strand:+ start:43 stop:216 length:174 start_codon:yes stop_codon:yes gene_type:complete
MININFTEKEAKFLSDYFENMKDKNELQYEIYNKIHDTFLNYEFNKWRKQKEVNNGQ